MSESKHSMRLASTPYHEPEILTILIQSSFLLLLNVVNFLLDKAVYCGLLGQVFIGVAWGTPGANWIGANAESAIAQLGYLGLLLLVYEGGLSTSLPSLKANLFLSLWVAITGISLPIGLSFVLRHVIEASPLQCFAAGAALSSTSLGTTFTVLSTSGLAQSRLGVVLTSAAMMDDVIGLVMVQVISNLGQDSGSLNAIIVVRPLLVSVGFAVVAPLICLFLASPTTACLNRRRRSNPQGNLNKAMSSRQTPFVLHTLILIGYITASSYAGTSNLFAAYIAGASISWWDSEVDHVQVASEQEPTNAAADATGSTSSVISSADASGLGTYNRVYSATVETVLRPFFFASIGFSIPITEMFTGEIVWKGLVYTLLMALGKLFCGVWLLRLPRKLTRAAKMPLQRRGKKVSSSKGKLSGKPPTETAGPMLSAGEAASHASGHDVSTASQVLSRTNRSKQVSKDTRPAGVKPRSVYPASILGCAMMARGEIGFLISSIAESKGIFTNKADTGPNSKIFLCVTWAIMLCTVIGPLAVGLLVQRIKKLERQVEKSGGQVKGDVLGVWGIT
ncbi:sodium/hydrogen exchanger family protein [Beauveria bassiana ARSEF 2860]|uniref:Sodium/hydrogen exchanger family protein n=1 Tax=Beauveria bassiana (strain ARSEF 2860) TaxID=655819 RepID=J5J319_BEAB2|nr:sodium/hydrogen exchanger family protein [Beauveria bassiana ARSEF 2860]EJP61188.1 sodium/hydrogen exchanger family protein [Beauveria bassiana ARSEF 2860]